MRLTSDPQYIATFDRFTVFHSFTYSYRVLFIFLDRAIPPLRWIPRPIRRRAARPLNLQRQINRLENMLLSMNTQR